MPRAQGVLEPYQDYRNSLKKEEADFIEQKAFIRSFVKRIEVDKEQVTLRYTLPLPLNGMTSKSVEVLPIVTLSGAGGTIPRTETDSCLELSGGRGRV